MDIWFVCMHKHVRVGGSVGCPPRKFLEIRCSEIASEAILGQKQNRIATWLAEYCIQFLAVHVRICDFEFPQEKVLKLAEQQMGDITGPPRTNMHIVAATRLVWTALILNSRETSGPLSNGRTNLRVSCVYEIFCRSKGGFTWTPSNPPCLRAWICLLRKLPKIFIDGKVSKNGKLSVPHAESNK